MRIEYDFRKRPLMHEAAPPAPARWRDTSEFWAGCTAGACFVGGIVLTFVSVSTFLVAP